MANSIRTEAARHELTNIEIQSQLAGIPPDARIVSYDNGNAFDLRYSYLLKPRKLLVVNPDFLDLTDQLRAIDAFSPDFIFSIKTISNLLPVDATSHRTIDISTGPLNIYRYQE